MAKNFVQEGDVLDLNAPYSVTSGDGVLVGSLFAVALGTAAIAAPMRGKVEGVFDLAKAPGVIAAGARVYWDNTARVVTTVAATNTLIGAATRAASNGDLTVRVYLDGCVR